MEFETLASVAEHITFEHTGLKPQMSLEYLPANRLGHALRRTCERLVYEQYRGHDAFIFYADEREASRILYSLIGVGTVASLLLGKLKVFSNPEARVEVVPPPSALGWCNECQQYFGQIDQSLKNLDFRRARPLIWIQPEVPEMENACGISSKTGA